MQSDNLTISVVFGTGVKRPEIQQVLESLPQLKLLEQTCDPQGYVGLHRGIWPDLVLVEMDGENQIPKWLETLSQEVGKTPILLCSHSREPDFLIKMMQVGIREFLPLPLTRKDLEAAVNRIWITRRQQHSESQEMGKLVVVTGHKGGSGATTVAVNLSVALAEQLSESIALVDLGRPFPDVGHFLDLEPNYSIMDLLKNQDELDQGYIQRILQPYGEKLFILHGCSDFREQENMDPEALMKIFSQLRSLYKYTIIDLSHWLDDFFLQVVMEADMVLMLTGLTVPDLRNLKKLWPALLEWYQDRRKIKVVVNRFDRGSGLQLKDAELILQQPIFATLNSDYGLMMESLNQGTPLGVTALNSKLWRSMKTLAQQVARELPGGAELGAAEDAPKKKFWLF